MHCPFCGSTASRVVDTTPDAEHDEIRRRRLCQSCGRRFSTIERVRAELPLIIKDSPDGLPPRREAFDRAKLRRSILTACAKRPISEAAVDRLIASIETQLCAENAGEVSSRRVGELLVQGLRELDEIAYIRYAIVFLELEDLSAVRGEIDRILGGDTPHHPRSIR